MAYDTKKDILEENKLQNNINLIEDFIRNKIREGYRFLVTNKKGDQFVLDECSEFEFYHKTD